MTLDHRPYSKAVPVGVASAVILGPNLQRKRVSGVNSSVNWIWINRGSGPAVVGTGSIGLAPNGFFVDEPDQNGYIYKGPYTAIATGVASNLGLTED